MMKLNTLVLLVLCGVAVNQAPASGLTIGSCPDFLDGLAVDCALNIGSSLTAPFDCSSSVLQCLSNSVLDALGLSPNTTKFDSADLDNALVSVGISASVVNTCSAQVGNITIDEVDINNCDAALIGQFVLCLLRKFNCIL